ncbi:CHAT domain-containing tetratricopeptide repeat protein [Nostoc sp. ChiQUE01b]|uniref:CHAT domain-containing tetratricopeptide repeat protein n=1 Tax=Nostoc sp. ChiQUE01b TaxID=3075376 RepID=UPI002AD3AF11|nr:tetratricopeptide repeat protein [Nostoc sp. ChiQUE01b]MDZ8262893.1 tetratricopeptide repeat protein [Nostoc sp. ChiQUE01b]
MRSKKLVLGIVALVTAVLTGFAFNSLTPFFRIQVLGQSTETSKSEAEHLLNLCREQLNKNQFQAALQSCQQAATTAQTIGDRSTQAKSLINLGLAYLNTGNAKQAIANYQQALAIAQTISDRTLQAKSLNNLGLAYLNTGNVKQAIAYCQQASEIAREIKDPQLEAAILQALSLAQVQNNPRKPEADRLFDLGIQQFQNSQFKAASQSWEQALLIYREIKYPWGEVDALVNLGNAYDNLGDFPKAIHYLEQSLPIAREIKYRQRESYSLRNLGSVYINKGDYTKAIYYLKPALAIAREIKDRQGEGATLGDMGLVYESIGDYPKAISHHQQSLAIAREIKYPLGEIKSLSNLGIVYLDLGNYPKAIESQQQSLAIVVRETKDRSTQGKILGNIGNIYFFLGDYPKAVDYHQESLKIAREIKNRKAEGQSLLNLGAANLYLGYDQKAIHSIKQSLAIAQEIEDRHSEGNALSNLSDIYTKLEDYPKAISYDRQHLDVARKINDRKGQSIALGNIGLVYSYQGDYPKAIDYSQQSLAIAREINDSENKGKLLINLGFYFYKQGNFNLAESTLFEGMTVRESLRGRELKDSEKVSIFDTQRNTYRALQQVLIAQKKNDLALEIAERGRARAFVELLASKLSPNPQQQSLTFPTIEKIKQTAKQQNTTLVQYSIVYDDFKVKDKIQFKESELYIWVIKPTGEVKFHPVDLKPLWQKQNTSLDDLVSKTLESLGVAIDFPRSANNEQSFAVGDLVKPNDAFAKDPAWKVIAVNPQNRTVKIQLSDRKDTEQPVEMERKFTEVTKVSYSQAANINLQQLHKILIDPIADLLPKDKGDRVTFIPQGSLFFVPFPALQDADRKYLIEKHTILTAPSIQVLDLTRQKRQQILGTSKDVLVVGNPTMPKVSLYPGKPATQLDPLPDAEIEAKEVAQIYKTNAIIGKKATKSAILPLLPKARIIHLATHGLLDDFTGGGVPGAVALAPEPLNKGKEEGTNGLLTASEIFDLKLNNTELVVLSACNTGVGKITGDGVIGLSRSLISAGVPSVIVSLWSIPDAPTASLMTEFYQQLQQGNDKAFALRQAMLKTMEKHPDPKNWAAFTLIGESN